MQQKRTQLRHEEDVLLREAQTLDAAEDSQCGGVRRGDEWPAELAFRGERDTPPGGPPDKAQRNFTDPESRFMPNAGGKDIGLAYNCQACPTGDGGRPCRHHLLGTVIGLLSGYFRRLDNPLMRFTDMILALPSLPLLLAIIMLFRDVMRRALGPELGIFMLVVFVIGALGWMPTARVARSAVLSIKEKEYIEAAVSTGIRQYTLLWKHILPNVLSPIIVSATLGVAGAILTESALSFLGLGFPPDVPTWGRLLFENKDFITYNPWLTVWPGLFISVTILSINFMGDGLRDALDPRLRT